MIAKKKSDKANLEKNRFAFFQIGLIVASTLCLAAFQYGTIELDKVAKTNYEELNNFTSLELPPKEIVFEEKKQPKQRVSKTKLIIEVEPVEKDVKTKDVKEKKKIKIVNVTFGDNEDGDENGEELPKVDTTTYPIVSQMPEFPGGYPALMEWVNNNIKLSPFAEPIDGKVYVRFVVDKEGNVTNVTLTKGLHRDYDKASIAVVKKMPKWTPGEQAGKRVNVRYDLPIQFTAR